MVTLPHFAFRGLPYTINDDFHQNLLYSGCFTEGRAISESLFQHNALIKIMVVLNNVVSSSINWYYFIHYFFIWTPISLYFIKFSSKTLFNRSWNADILVIIFLGVWISREFTFSWISSLNAIIAWVWFWKSTKKSYFDWFSILLMIAISYLVRTPSLILISIIALIIRTSDYLFLADQEKPLVGRFITRNVLPIVILLFFIQLNGSNKTNGVDTKKFPFAWVTEEQYLSKTILEYNKSVYDDVDLQLSKGFYFDDRFDGYLKDFTAISAVRATMGYSYFKKMLYQFVFDIYKLLLNMKYGSLEFLILIILLPLYSLERNSIKSLFLCVGLILFLLITLNIFLNLPILKSRVVLPPLVFVVFYFNTFYNKLFINRNKHINYMFFLVTSIYSLFYYTKSQKNLILSEQIITQSKLNKTLSAECLYMDQTGSSILKIGQIGRICTNNLDLPILPFGWMMLSNTFAHKLKFKGYNNLDQAFKSGRLQFLNSQNKLPEPWVNYFKKYFSDYKMVPKSIIVMGNKVFEYKLIKEKI